MDLFMYLCVDGTWRQRCREHVPKNGPYAPARVNEFQKFGGRRDSCPVCFGKKVYVPPKDGG